MIICFNTAEFCKVPAQQTAYFKKETSEYLRDGLEEKRYKSHPRRLFDVLSDVVLGKGNPVEDTKNLSCVSIDWPAKDIKLVCQHFIQLQHELVDTGFGKYFYEEYFNEDPTALFRNISHLLAVIDCKIRGKDRLYIFYC